MPARTEAPNRWYHGALLALLALPFPGCEGQRKTVAVVSVTTYPSLAAHHTSQRGFCPWHQHQAYCDRWGYECFVVYDFHGPGPRSPWQWHFTHNDYHFAPHWFKIYVLMALLPKFEWVILVDDDSVFRRFLSRRSPQGSVTTGGSCPMFRASPATHSSSGTPRAAFPLSLTCGI